MCNDNKPAPPIVAERDITAKEIEIVRSTIQTVLHGMKNEEIWSEKKKCYCKMVDYGVLEDALAALRRYETLLVKEPLVEQIADSWRNTGAFDEGTKGVV